MGYTKNICILGSTGSIGTQSLDVIRQYPDLFNVTVLTAQNNADLLIHQAIEFKPKYVVIGCKNQFFAVKKTLEDLDIKVLNGKEALLEVVTHPEIDVVINSLVGFSGLMPTIEAIKAKKNIALANKETLVVAGELITSMVKEKKVYLYPIDSEHSAIFQCLAGENSETIEKLILTASGGPFRGLSRILLQEVKKEQALQHPNWNMGSKITIDSSTLMNKGLEVIEARWLFDISYDRIEVVIHPQSVIHSMVQFFDGSIKAQLGIPDMRIPIQYALTYPERLRSNFPRFEFSPGTAFSFEQPDYEAFPCLGLAYEAIKNGGNMPCVLNASNEIAVSAFLHDKLAFVEIPDLIEKCISTAEYYPRPSLEDLVDTDFVTRNKATQFLRQYI